MRNGRVKSIPLFQLLSDEVGVLHGHVEAFLNEGVVRVDVGTRPDHRLSALGLVNACGALGAEPSLARVEHNGVLKVLAPSLVHRSGALCNAWLVLVKSGAWNLQFQALSVENLVVIEAW